MRRRTRPALMAPKALHREFPFSDEDFLDIAARAHAAFGLHLGLAKKQLVYSRLARRLRALGLRDFEGYRAVLRGPEGALEAREMLCALTTNVTQFYRERHHFDLLARDALPGLLRHAEAGGRVRFWSAGCSAGQEAYSLALTILALCPRAPRHDIRILATDVDPVVLERARLGRYPAPERDALPPPAREAHTVAGPDGTFEMGPAPRALVEIAELNLTEAWPMRRAFDAILCRNVAIYFDAATQARLWTRLADAIVPGGMLLIGHSERLTGPATATLRACGITAYRKTTDPFGIRSGAGRTG